MANYEYYFAHEMCGLCIDAHDTIVQLPPTYRMPSATYDMEQEAEYVHPVTLPAEVVKRAARKPAWDAEEL